VELKKRIEKEKESTCGWLRQGKEAAALRPSVFNSSYYSLRLSCVKPFVQDLLHGLSRRCFGTAIEVKQARGCDWGMYWSVRLLGKRGSGQSAGQLGITRDTHNHILAPNQFIYKVHQKGYLTVPASYRSCPRASSSPSILFGNAQSPRGLEFIDRSEHIL
jgi:hypothetical protein